MPESAETGQDTNISPSIPDFLNLKWHVDKIYIYKLTYQKKKKKEKPKPSILPL